MQKKVQKFPETPRCECKEPIKEETVIIAPENHELMLPILSELYQYATQERAMLAAENNLKVRNAFEKHAYPG